MPEENYHIFIIDDNPRWHKDMRLAFQKHYVFDGAENIEKLKKKLKEKAPYDLILLDLVLDDSKPNEKVGLTLIPEIRHYYPLTPIVVVTNHKEFDIIVEAGKRGAADFLYKGDYNDPEDWHQKFQRLIKNSRLKEENQVLKKELEEFKSEYEYINPEQHPLIGVSDQMETIRRTLKTVAGMPNLTVLITGETGVGKGAAARFLHANSNHRANKPFVEIHIQNIAPSLWESTLFGALKGVFTDAKENIKGLLHVADQGIAFLDEIGYLSTDAQSKLLQFVQDKKIRPIGAQKEIKLDVQIVAATNKILREEVAKGNFLKDLYQRLKMFPIEIPPLRERREDIMPLMEHFFKLPMSRIEEKFVPGILPLLVEEYDWEGNVRELRNAIEYMEVQQEVRALDKITFDCLSEEIQEFRKRSKLHPNKPFYNELTVSGNPTEPHKESESPNVNSIVNKDEQIAIIELTAIEREMKEKNGVKKDVAKALGLSTSDLIKYRIDTYLGKFPQLSERFPEIRKRYPKLFDQDTKTFIGKNTK